MNFSSKEIISILQKNGWTLDRVRGSHNIFIKNNLTVAVPHPKKDLSEGLCRAILKTANLLDEIKRGQ